MPVSSPSYFPPSRGTDQIVGITAGQGQTGARVFLAGQNAGQHSTVSDIIVIGDNSGGGSSAWVNAGLPGSIVIGSTSFEQDFDCTTGKLTFCATGPILSYGINNFTSAVQGARLAHTMAIGSNIAAQGTCATGNNYDRNLLIGNYIWQNQNLPAGAGSTDNILLGLLVGSASSAVTVQFISNVVIGVEAMRSISASSHQSRNVYIGYRAMLAPSGASSDNVILGYNSPSTSGNIQVKDTVAVGSQITIGTSTTGRNTLVGSRTTYGTGTDSVVIGYSAGRPTNFTGSGNIVLGSLAGSTLPAAASDKIVIETNYNTLRSALYGDMATGNIVVGKSTAANQRDLVNTPNGATNILQIPMGSKSGTSPTSSGYLYVDSTANNSDNPLHFVNSTGLDFSVGPSGPKYWGTGNGLITPAALAAGSTNDWNPTGIGQSQVINVTPDAAGSTLTGLVAQAGSRVIVLINQGTGTLTLTHNDAGSAAANRFFLPSAVSLGIVQNSAVMLWYDAAAGHWHALSWS